MENTHRSIEEFLIALSNETRRKMITVIGQARELNVNQITGHFNLSRPNISHHLGILKRAGLLKTRKEGKETYYSVNKQFILDSLRGFIDYMEKCC